MQGWLAVCIAVLTMAAVIRASAEQVVTAAKPDKNYTGTVVAVDPKEHTLEVKGMWLSKKFNLGLACDYRLLDKSPGTANDLRPGEKVIVSYQNADGVLVANRVEQQPVRFEGVVQVVDPDNHSMIVRFRRVDKTFHIADECNVVLRDDKSGTLADIRAGNHVMVTYESPDGDVLVARQIAQTSVLFTGTLTAIDLSERTVKAKALFGTKKFIVADNCDIMLNGKTAQLSDLKPNDALVFNYDEINGVNIVNRITPVEVSTNSIVFSGTQVGY